MENDNQTIFQAPQPVTPSSVPASQQSNPPIPSVPPAPYKGKSRSIINILLIIGFILAGIALLFVKPDMFQRYVNPGTNPTENTPSPIPTLGSDNATQPPTQSPNNTAQPATETPLPTSPPQITKAIGEPVVTSPQPNTTISSPLIVNGRAPGSWFFEGQLTIKLTDANHKPITQSIGREVTPGSWTSTTMVDFQGKLTFSTSAKKGLLIIENDNPSGLPENQKSYEIPVNF